MNYVNGNQQQHFRVKHNEPIKQKFELYELCTGKTLFRLRHQQCSG